MLVFTVQIGETRFGGTTIYRSLSFLIFVWVKVINLKYIYIFHIPIIPAFSMGRIQISRYLNKRGRGRGGRKEEEEREREKEGRRRKRERRRREGRRREGEVIYISQFLI